MKKTLIILAAMSLGLVCKAQTSSNVLISAGYLYSTDTSTYVPDGTLFQVVISPDMAFLDPTATSFVGDSGNDLVLYSSTINSVNSGAAGYFQETVNINLSTYSTGEYLAIRWFPTLTAGASVPGAGTIFGQFIDPSWIVPAAGATVDLKFLTLSTLAGSYAETDGLASMTIPSAVPEPATYAAIFGAIALAGAGLKRRKLI